MTVSCCASGACGWQPRSNPKPTIREFAAAFPQCLVMQLQVSWSARCIGVVARAIRSKGRFSVSAPAFPRAATAQLHAGTLEGGRMEKIEIPSDCCARRKSQLTPRPTLNRLPDGSIHEPDDPEHPGAGRRGRLRSGQGPLNAHWRPRGARLKERRWVRSKRYDRWRSTSVCFGLPPVQFVNWRRGWRGPSVT